MYTKAPTGKSREQLNALHSTRLLGAATRIRGKKPIVDPDLQRSRHGGSNAKSGWNTSRVTVYLGFLTSRVVYRFSRARRKLIVLRRHLWNIVQRGRPKEDTHQLKRRRLLPDVRDPPEQGTANVDMMDIWKLHRWHGGLLHGGRDRMRGWEGQDVSPLSHIFAKFHSTLCFGFCLFGGLRFVLVCVGLFCLCDGLVNFCTQLVPVHHVSSGWPTTRSPGNAGKKNKKMTRMSADDGLRWRDPRRS